MTQSESPAVGGETNAPVETAPTPQDYFENLAREEFGITDEQDEETPAEGAEEAAPEGAEGEEATEETADDLPPIEPPHSLSAEEKEAFNNLPREAQEFTARRIGELEKGFNTKAQEAARARQDAEQAAIQQLAQVNAAYAQQYQQIAEAITVSEPDPMLQVQDPIAYAQQMRAYQQANAQRTAAQQQAMQHAQQAQWQAAQLEQVNHAEQHRIIVENFPEYADPTTGPELQRKLTAVAKRIGYPDELIGQARAQDILAMRTVSDAFDKADKYEALMKNQMTKVRAAKGKPPVTTRPGTAQGSDAVRAQSAQAALETAITSNNREVKGAAFLQYLEKTGQIKF